MGSSLDLRGVYVPLITPFTVDDKPALDEIERLANECLDAGAAGLVALGTTGEPATLEADERDAVVRTIGRVCAQRSATFIIGAGTNNTKAAVTSVEQANSYEGVAAILSVVPYYTRPSEEGIVQHFKALASASDVPIIIYNIPFRTGRGLGTASLLELAHTPNVAALKQSIGGVLDEPTLVFMAEKPDDFHVLWGDDAFAFPIMATGGSGGIAASAHVCTAGYALLAEAALNNDYVLARKLGNILLPVSRSLFSEPGPSVIKGVVCAQNRTSTPNMRLPMTAASQGAVDAAMLVVAEAEKELATYSAD